MGEIAEKKRLDEAREKNIPWKKWGPYLTERQWGTVREDYSENGAGLGASHQTGWTGLVAKMIQLYGLLDPKRALVLGKEAAFGNQKRAGIDFSSEKPPGWKKNC